jgi:pyridoxamine 5'-phosphate oxidase
MDTPLDIAALRHDYVAHGLRRADLHPDPIKQFAQWFGEAAAAKIRDVNAMNLALATPEGRPSSRIVLLKAISDAGSSFSPTTRATRGVYSMRIRTRH